jgi:hypothetical protein
MSEKHMRKAILRLGNFFSEAHKYRQVHIRWQVLIAGQAAFMLQPGWHCLFGDFAPFTPIVRVSHTLAYMAIVFLHVLHGLR